MYSYAVGYDQSSGRGYYVTVDHNQRQCDKSAKPIDMQPHR